jgi:hypothetical protein
MQAAGGFMPRVSLEHYVRKWALDAQIEGDRVILEDRTWHARRCPCGLHECDGWLIVPAQPVDEEIPTNMRGR